MKIARLLSRIGLFASIFYAAGAQLLEPDTHSAQSVPIKTPFAAIVKTIVFTAIAVLILLNLGMVAFVFSGVYDLAAAKPHTAPVDWLLRTLTTRAVKFHSNGISVPAFDKHALLKDGFVLYRKNCQPCHGAPGIAPEQIGRGINPKPPQLVTASADWSDPQLYWIISEGMKMSGMPAFAPRLSDRDRWSIVAFLRRLNRFSPADYSKMNAGIDQGIMPTSWGDDDREGFFQIRSANPQRGWQLIQRYGCIACHTIPNLGSGRVGPPLTRFAERQYLAGIIVNAPTNTVNWIMDPRKYKPNTAMPNIGVKKGDAVDITAYLYKLGSSKRLNFMQQP